MTTIRELLDPVHAGLIVSFLKDNHIDAVLADENSSAWIEARLLIPIRLQVPADQVDQANALLKEFDEAPAFTEEDDTVNADPASTGTTFTIARSLAASPAAIWQALIDPAQVVEYHLAPLTVLDLRSGGEITYGTEEGAMITGQILDFVPGQQLVHTFRFSAALEGTGNDPETTVSYLIEADADGAILTLTHTGFPKQNQTYVNISGGWPHILDALKAFVETR